MNLLFGDSHAKVYSYMWETMCFPGYCIYEMEPYFEPKNYKSIVIMAGTNDFGYGKTTEEVADGLIKMVGDLKNVFLILPWNRHIDKLADMIPDHIGIIYFEPEKREISDDNIHLNIDGSNRLIQTISRVL